MAGRMSRDEYLAQRQERVDELTSNMSDRVSEIATGEEAQELLAFAAKFRSRSFRNTAMVFEQWQARNEISGGTIPEPSALAGYKQFQAMGRQVRKGEKGYQILSPVTARFASSTPENSESWRRLASREKPAEGEQVQSRMVGVKPATVFDIAQTDGPEIPSMPDWAPIAQGETPAGLRDAVEAEIGREGYRIEGDPHGRAEGTTFFDEKRVAYNAARSDNEQTATLLHELGHIKMHSGAEARELPRGQREFEAETYAHVLAGLHGMDTTESSATYSGGWTFAATRADPDKVAEMTVDSGARVSEAVNDTIDRMPAGASVPDGSIDHLEKKGPTKNGPEASADRRVRNALRMEAQAPALIREEPAVDMEQGPRVRARR